MHNTRKKLPRVIVPNTYRVKLSCWRVMTSPNRKWSSTCKHTVPQKLEGNFRQCWTYARSLDARLPKSLDIFSFVWCFIGVTRGVSKFFARILCCKGVSMLKIWWYSDGRAVFELPFSLNISQKLDSFCIYLAYYLLEKYFFWRDRLSRM